MSNVPVFVGIDYHQDSVQVCVLDSDGKRLANRSVGNSAAAVAEAATRHGRPVRMAVEACCGAANLADELIAQHKLPVQLAHPGYVARLKRSPDKTDYSDAGLLADLSRVNYLPTVWLAPEGTRQLRRLVRHRTQLVRRRRDLKLRIRGLLRENRLKCEGVSPWRKAWLAWLQTEAKLSAHDRWIADDHLLELAALSKRIAAVEAQIIQATADDPLVARLMEYAGVGLVTAVTIRAEIGRFDRFVNGKQAARFCGVTPQNASSGARQADAGLIRAGNPELRAVLIELAHRLIHRIPGRWAELAYGMLARGKPKNVVVCAIANRWVRWVYHDLKQPTSSKSTSARARQKGPPLPPSPSLVLSDG